MPVKAVTVLFLASGVLLGEAVAVLAQSVADPVAGGAGWIGAGLLGSVLAWLLFVHLPAKDKQLKEMIEGKDAMMRDLTDKHRQAIDSVVAHCQSELRRSEDLQTKAHEEQQRWLQRIHESSRETVHAVRNLGASISSRTQLADAFQSASVPAWTKNLDGVLMSWNFAAEDLLGWKQGEVVGKSVYKTLIPADRHDEERDMLRRIAEGETLSEYETLRVHKDGHRVKLIMFISPVRDRNGRVIGASSIAREP